MIDYRELLLKYINHVGDEEGITFISCRSKPAYISDEEWAELEKMDDKEYRSLTLGGKS